MRCFPFFFFLFSLTAMSLVHSGQQYLAKFMQYSAWREHLPLTPDQDFITFIEGTSPLSQKLREQWLFQLALQRNWSTYLRFYQPSNSLNLRCYHALAQHHLGQTQAAIQTGQILWLTGQSQPDACNQLFALLLKTNDIDDDRVTARVALALEQENVRLALYLLQRRHPPRLDEIKTLSQLFLHPSHVTTLPDSPLRADFYLYGLTSTIPITMTKALALWANPLTKHVLSHTQQQHFLAKVALYKAMRNEPDAATWFGKVNPSFQNEILLGWEIRLALKHKQWAQVIRLIARSTEKESPCWHYWLARAEEAIGHQEAATAEYQTLAKNRHYYGFLASFRLKQAFHFEHEQPPDQHTLLKPYQPITDQIRSLYLSNQMIEASRLVTDFASELPKNEKSALANWLADDLQWHDKSIALSNTDELNNQLSLRFPLPYQGPIVTYAHNYQIQQPLIYAIIRQESGFRDKIASSAGALGLMQIMPATARVISKQVHLPYSGKEQLLSKEHNIHIGIAYLSILAKRFHKHPILMAAAYNAGPKQAAYWLKNNPTNDLDVWIETLPWYETRNYLKNILAFYAVYQYRLQLKSDLKPIMNGLKT